MSETANRILGLTAQIAAAYLGARTVDNKARRRMHVAARQESSNDMIRGHTEPGVSDFYEKAATIRPDCICVEGVRAPPEWGDVVTRFKV